MILVLAILIENFFGTFLMQSTVALAPVVGEKLLSDGGPPFPRAVGLPSFQKIPV